MTRNSGAMVLPSDYLEMAAAAWAASSSELRSGPDEDECDDDCTCGDDLG